MEKKFNSEQEEKAYKLGQLDGMLACFQNTIKNIKLQYEKIYQKKCELKNESNNDTVK